MTNYKDTDIDTEETLFEEISADEVSSFLQEESEEENHNARAVGEIPDDVKALLEDDSKDTTPEATRVTLAPDPTFEDSKRDAFENMYVTVRDVDVPVTDEDKTVYLKCLLHSTPITLTITAKNGVSAACRSLSVYEGDVAAAAMGIYMKEYPDTAIGFIDSIMQQYKLAMMITSFCGKKLDYLQYEVGVNGTREDHAKDLYDKANAILDVPGPVYGMYVRLANVFQYKLAKLHEAAFNEDFWFPADSD